MFRSMAVIVLMFFGLTGCHSFPPTLPEGYVGPTATIKDTNAPIDMGKAEFFYLSHVDGNKIMNSVWNTYRASDGLGEYLSAVVLEHKIPAKTMRLGIIGETIYAMPARALMSTVYEVKGEIEFTPLPDAVYIIQGNLTEEGCTVQVEHEETGEVVGLVESEGECKLDFFEKQRTNH